jgi:hypothetical protein
METRPVRFAAKPNPHRPHLAPALGLRAGVMALPVASVTSHTASSGWAVRYCGNIVVATT